MKMTRQAYIDFGASDAATLAKHANQYSRARYESFVGGTSWQAKAYMAGFDGTAEPTFPPAEPVADAIESAAHREQLDTSAYDRAKALALHHRLAKSTARALMIYANRARSAELRERQASSDKARTVHAHVAFNLACDQTTYERGCRVADALVRFICFRSYYVRFPIRIVWQDAYRDARAGRKNFIVAR